MKAQVRGGGDRDPAGGDRQLRRQKEPRPEGGRAADEHEGESVPLHEGSNWAALTWGVKMRPSAWLLCRLPPCLSLFCLSLLCLTLCTSTQTSRRDKCREAVSSEVKRSRSQEEQSPRHTRPPWGRKDPGHTPPHRVSQRPGHLPLPCVRKDLRYPLPHQVNQDPGRLPSHQLNQDPGYLPTHWVRNDQRHALSHLVKQHHKEFSPQVVQNDGIYLPPWVQKEPGHHQPHLVRQDPGPPQPPRVNQDPGHLPWVKKDSRHTSRPPASQDPGRPPTNRVRQDRRKGLRVRAEDSPPRIIHHPSDVVVKAGSPATLSCRADGSPKPTIKWLRNSHHLEMSWPDGHLQPLLLPEGSLFFLSVEVGRSYEGVYTCVASNTYGEAVSHEASLFIAALQEEFIMQPSDVEVAEGEVAVLNCTPPHGHPEPNVIWKLNGVLINTPNHHFTQLNGNLIVAPAEKQHSGSYVCVASNTAGVRQSRAARLSVLARPILLIRPENVSVRPGESAEFSCRAKGDPPPTVVWSREQGPLPNGRYLVNPDHTLQIHYVTAKDSGRYTCTVVNDVGMTSVSAQLLVEEAEDLEQRDLHRELSAVRVSLDNVSIEAPGSNMSLVQWKLLALPAQPHFLEGFEVLHRSLLPASFGWMPQNVSLPGLQARVGPLQRGYKYEFKVRPYGGGLYGRESNTRHLRVPETVPSAAPLAVSITVNHQLNNSIRLSWQAPPQDTHNGIIQGYQVWCVDSQQQFFQNWTLDSSRHVLDITSLVPGQRYWLSMAAVNGAGVGELSEPHGFVINPQLGDVPDPDSRRGHLSPVLGLLQDPVLIGCVGALLLCVLMVAAIYLFRHRCGSGRLLPVSSRNHDLRRLAREDLIIKHRMAAPDSPWISGSWRPAFSHKYQDLWAQRQNHPGLRSTSLPVASKTDSSYLDSAVPIATDGCGVYGTFYVDLRGSSLKTFNSPGRIPKKPHATPPQQGGECIQIFSPPGCKSSPPFCRDALPWKQVIRPQPRMGVLRESWEKNFTKQELHAANSVPLLSRTQTCPQSLYTQRLNHIPAGCNDCDRKATGRPRLLQYSASLQLLDMLPPPPPSPPAEADDTHSLSSDEGSSRSTKLTVDTGSIQSVCLPSRRHVQPIITSDPPSIHLPSACRPTPLDHEQDGTLTSQDATEYLERSPTEYLELSPRPERCSMLPEARSPLSQYLAPTRGYRIGPVVEDKDEEVHADLRWARHQSTPSSYYSDWDSSLWNTWSSAMDRDLDSSARTSLISSVDSCYTCDSSTCDSSTFSRLLAAAAESLSGASMSDFSPPASPLSLGGLYPPSFPPERVWPGGPEPLPARDWGTAWMEEMEAQYRARCPPTSRKPPDSQQPY